MRRPLCLFIVLLLPNTIHAQVGIEQSPTRSVHQPGSGIADGAEPFGVVVNPASLGELSGWTLGLRHTETASQSPFTGRGTGIYAAASLPALRLWSLVDLSWLSRIQLGAAVEILRPPEQVGTGTSGKITLSLSMRPLSWLALGLSYGHLFAPASLAYDNLDTLNLGTRIRLGRRLAAGLVLHDVTAPGPQAGRPLQRVYELELLARPFIDDRLELAAGARLGERYVDVEPRARLWVRPRPGIAVGADATILLRSPGQTGVLDYRVAAGVQLDLGRAGASAFAQFAAPSEGEVGPAGIGGSLAVRLSSARYPSLVPGPRYLLEILPERGDEAAEGFLRLLQRLRELERDPRAAGVYLRLDVGFAGWPEADELRQQLLRLRRAGKRVFVYDDVVSSSNLYLASAADRIFLHPEGMLHELGVTISHLNVKDTLDALGVRAEFLAIGEYKLGGNMFAASEPPPTAREQDQALLDARYQHLVTGIAGGRRLAEERVRRLIDQGLLTPPEARAAGLVDELATEPQAREALKKALGPAVAIVQAVAPRARFRGAAPPVIAVVRISGSISRERRDRPGRAAQAIRGAGMDRQVRALVLRIDSPGGTDKGAEELLEAIGEARKKKPVICSFGGQATSAAYEIATTCDRIFTGPLTVTGSIGLWWAHVDAGDLLRRIGVRRTTLSRGQNADLHHKVPVPYLGTALAYQSYSPAERARMMAWLQIGYDGFIDKVAKGRGLPRARVEALARGRLWTGAAAVEHRLCDQLGGLMDAVAEARRRARVAEGEDVELRYGPPRPPSLLRLALKEVGLSLAAAGLDRIGEVLESLPLDAILGPAGPERIAWAPLVR